ncbi:MAG: 16S rRNA (cytidine(1402)-2'-O)-methyltransferase [Oscillospiraceae bacterium]|jgi:16S rRNA (cytidine1402-2'-O)-methyltransferase|nr:16S rRNA (cytidine(1402)-2'-O)-methyltransferase [Oscillospiraceae bacterium]
MAGKLYLVPTPIGNLGDISRRAAETLEAADFLAAEDTRVTVKLLNHLGLKKPMTAYHRHNCDAAGPAILRRIEAGESCALVTDAGTPAVSDPGEELVALCAAAGVEVISLPGPCALTVALSVSGLPTGRFTFEGFLPLNKKNRRARLEGLAAEERTMIFYEAPHKLRATLEDLGAALGPDRPLTVCRELTKLHEEVLRTTIAGAAARFESQEPRGEFVLVAAGRPPEAEEGDEDGAMARVGELRRGGMALKAAAAQAAAEFGVKKRGLYNRALREINGDE